MGSILGNFFSNAADKSADETLVTSSIGAAAVSANAYLNAALEATTPEVRRLFTDFMSQSVMGHEALTNLAVKKGWMFPYDTPTKQLQNSLQSSQSVLTNAQ